MKKDIKPLPKEVQTLSTVSGQIRALHKMGWETGDIGRALGISYQNAYNVVKRPLKRKAKR